MSIDFAPVTRLAGRLALKSKDVSPKVLFAVGLVAVGTGTVLACRATLKVEGVLDEAASKLEDIKSVDVKQYSNNDRRSDQIVVYIETTYKLGRLYGPALVVGGIGVACLTGSHNILTKRNAALAAAYSSLDRTFKAYRQRVRDEIGEDKERELHYRVAQDEARRDLEVASSTKKRGAHNASIYARFFDESVRNWNREPEYNLVFLRNQQTWANDMLHARGHIFLNEVYDMIGLERSRAGNVVGWTRNGGDGYVDFGIFDGATMNARGFVNGWEPSILLDFNVDGPILDSLDDRRLQR